MTRSAWREERDAAVADLARSSRVVRHGMAVEAAGGDRAASAVLVEEEPSGGEPRVRLLVHPAVGPVAQGQVLKDDSVRPPSRILTAATSSG